jgi:hypothetical protein
MRTRNGKIARLPRNVREELNVRLERSEQSPKLLAWLNALPEVQEILRKEFNGEPVSKQNLSRWRLGGYQDWVNRQDFLDDARMADDFVSRIDKKIPGKAPVDQTATVLAARYGCLLMRWDGECTREFEAKTRVLNGLCRNVVELQREEHQTRKPVRSGPVKAGHAQSRL